MKYAVTIISSHQYSKIKQMNYDRVRQTAKDFEQSFSSKETRPTSVREKVCNNSKNAKSQVF